MQKMRNTSSPSTGPWKLFYPILAGATLRGRMLACLGALAGITLSGLIGNLVGGHQGLHAILLVAPMGASAVLVFAVPASPLAQPWSVIGGNVISAAVGVAIGHLIPEPALAAGMAVAGAIAAMSLLRCLHPPGGAAALIGVLGGPLGTPEGILFPLIPVGLNAVVLVAAGLAFHRLVGNSYPHRAVAVLQTAPKTSDLPAMDRSGSRAEDIDSALADLGETFDISRADIERLVRAIETRSLVRSYGELSCSDIMSRDVVWVDRSAAPSEARGILVGRDLRVLPVLDGDRRVVGSVGFAELERTAATVGELASPPVTAAPGQPAITLAALLADGATHAVIVVDEKRRLLGLVTQTDLLAVMAKGVTASMQPVPA